MDDKTYAETVKVLEERAKEHRRTASRNRVVNGALARDHDEFAETIDIVVAGARWRAAGLK